MSRTRKNANEGTPTLKPLPNDWHELGAPELRAFLLYHHKNMDDIIAGLTGLPVDSENTYIDLDYAFFCWKKIIESR